MITVNVFVHQLDMIGECFNHMCTCAQLSTGADCERDFDSCARNPCASDARCIDNSPQEHAATGLPFICVTCVAGFKFDSNGDCIRESFNAWEVLFITQ